ncbi:MAG: hypothetical protein ACHQ1H_09905 [Nitrososphaerales archaeon]
MPTIEALYTSVPLECKSSFHKDPIVTNGYYVFWADDSEFKFWKFLSFVDKSQILKKYFDEGKCLLCSIDEELMR